MRGGKLRDKVRIEQNAAAQNSIGDLIEDEADDAQWSTFASRRARVQGEQGWELQRADHLMSEQTHRVYLRKLEGVTVRMRVQVLSGPYSGKTLDVLEVKHPTPQETVLFCKELL